MKIRITDLIDLAEQLEGKPELGDVIDTIEVRPNEFAPRERASVAMRRVLAGFDTAHRRVRRWQR